MCLQLGLDLMTDARVHVVGTSEYQDARFLFLGTPGQDFPALTAHFCRKAVQRLLSSLNGNDPRFAKFLQRVGLSR